MRSPNGSTHRDRSSANGGSASSRRASPASKNSRAADGPRSFPPDTVVEVKALACELPCTLGLPLSRFSISEIKREILSRGLVATIGDTTLWRWLSQDAIRPWYHRSWIFPRDPHFSAKAGRVLDLYQGLWQGRPLGRRDFVICADEKTSIQARRRKYPTCPTGPGRPMRIEHEYQRRGAWAYLAAWDVRRARIFGRCEHKVGIAPFERLVRQVMSQPPYRSPKRIFWIVDNGTSHRGQRCQQRLSRKWPNLIVVHTPIHASWLNQVEIYFPVAQRKALTPNDSSSLTALQQRLLAFEAHYQEIAKPFQWRFTRHNLHTLMRRLNARARHAA
jgi:hypothetical protein